MLVTVIITSLGQIRTVFFLLTTLIPTWKVYKLILVVPRMICSRPSYSLLHPAILIKDNLSPIAHDGFRFDLSHLVDIGGDKEGRT